MVSSSKVSSEVFATIKGSRCLLEQESTVQILVANACSRFKKAIHVQLIEENQTHCDMLTAMSLDS